MTAPLHSAAYEPDSVQAGNPAAQPFTPELMADHMDGIAAFLGGTANVIMQLSLRPVGRGVLESSVDSGKVTLHPIKRLRTTLTYIAVAMMGTDHERETYREAVNRSHRPVHSGPKSPVKYNAFDPKLQLWVAACLYWGFADMYTRMHGPMDPERAEAFYQYSARFGTTLQMREEMWPADLGAFQQYWDENLALRGIEPELRDYFNDIIDLKMMPRPVQVTFARLQRFIVAGLLPQHLRDEMHLTWTENDQRQFDRMLRTISAVHNRLPKQARMFPMNFYLFDLRRRMRLGKQLV
ncbi:oxygenase MpaB family protein [Nocardia sp. NPDC051052]|uniref:oxygenase MpaB family protein n=1 Tax=Nocardia sp. NPDC051052 TaxID=3364322 RepID=UPI0037A13F92